MKFQLGQTVMTRGVSDFVEEHNLHHELHKLINRHANGDWGELPEEDIEMNNIALEEGNRLLSSYKLLEENVWIITEWDRSVTTVLFPHEY